MQYKKIMVLIILLISLLTLSAVNAADDSTKSAVSLEDTVADVVGVDNTQEIYSINDFAEENYSVNLKEDTYKYSNQSNVKSESSSIATKLTVTNVDAAPNSGACIVATLKDVNGRAVSGVKVGFAYNGVKYFATDANGQARYSTDGFGEGTYSVKVAFFGDDTYKASDKVISKVTISKVATKLTVTNVDAAPNSGACIVATLKDVNGRAVSGVKVGFAYNGVKYFATDANGQARYSTDGFGEGTYSVKVAFFGDDTYKASDKVISKVTLGKLATKLAVTNVDAAYNSGACIVATLKDVNGRAVSGVKVGFAYNGVKYFATDANGQARYSTDGFDEGTYSVKVAFFGDDTYKASDKVISKVTITKVATKLTSSDFYVLPKEENYLVATLKDVNGRAVSGVKVGFANNGVTYILTDAKGQAKYPTKDLTEGTYNVKMKFYGNDVYSASNQATAKIVVGKIATKLTSSDVTVLYGEEGYLVATLKDANGKAVKGVKVGFANNGVKYFSTDSKGQVKYSTDGLDLGVYTVKMAFYGTDVYEASNQAVAKIIVSAPTTKLTWKSGNNLFSGINTLKVLLTDTNDIALPGKTVKLTINSNTYSVTTDSNGYATFNAQLIPGTHTVSYSFEKDDMHKESSGSAKITVNNRIDNVYGYFVFGSDMKNVNLNSLAADGTTDLFLNYYAIEKHGMAAVENWIASANKLGMRVHIWMQCFYDGSWVNPVSNGKHNTAYFNSIISEAQGYAKINGVSGIFLDYLRYPGTAYRTSGGTSAISEFTKSITNSIHKINPSIIVSAALMPETTSSEYYYGQDYSAISSTVDVVMPMIYKGNYGKSTSWIKTTAKWYVDNSKGAKVWTILQAYKSDDDETKLSISELSSDIRSAKSGGSQGVISFRYGLSNLVNFNKL